MRKTLSKRVLYISALVLGLGFTPTIGAPDGFDEPTASRAEAGAGLRHPVVLVHGISIGKRFTGGNSSDYWGTIPRTLRDAGVEVLVVDLSGLNTIEFRAYELREQILQAYPDPSVKLNLIAHSFGGLDSRYLISSLGMGDRVASLTTISSPHRGSPIADVLLGVLPGSVSSLADSLLNAFGGDYDVVLNVSTDYMVNDFNPQNPNDPRVYYQSVCGKANPSASNAAPLSGRLYIPWFINWIYSGANDGTVTVDSARWGRFRGLIPADHLAQIDSYNSAAIRRAFDADRFYMAVVFDLARQGY